MSEVTRSFPCQAPAPGHSFVNGMVQTEKRRAVHHTEVERKAKGSRAETAGESGDGQSVECKLSGKKQAVRWGPDQEQVRRQRRKHGKGNQEPEGFVRKEEQ